MTDLMRKHEIEDVDDNGAYEINWGEVAIARQEIRTWRITEVRFEDGGHVYDYDGGDLLTEGLLDTIRYDLENEHYYDDDGRDWVDFQGTRFTYKFALWNEEGGSTESEITDYSTNDYWDEDDLPDDPPNPDQEALVLDVVADDAVARVLARENGEDVAIPDTPIEEVRV